MDEQKKMFPQPGDYFAIYPLSELAINSVAEDQYWDKDSAEGRNTRKEFLDRLYNRAVFKCIDSNDTRIVCLPESLGGDRSFRGIKMLSRRDWRIDDVNALLTALTIKKEGS